MSDLCVTHVPIFRRLAPEHQRAIADLARPIDVARGGALYRQGERNAPLVVVHQGRVKLARLSRDGRERVVDVLGPGDFSGEAALLTGARPDHSAIALERSVACSFRREDFAGLLARHPQVGLTMMSTMSRRLAESRELLDQVTSRDVPSRLADYLLGLEARRSPAGLDVELPAPKKDIASLLGTTPESLSRALAKFADGGIIALGAGGQVTILDADALGAAAEE